MADRPVILVVGGGYVGLYTALRLQKRLSRGRAEIIVVDPQPHMTYQPFLPEAAAGSVEPRHVVVPLRRTLPRCRVVTGAARGIGMAIAERLVEELDPQSLEAQLQRSQHLAGTPSETRLSTDDGEA